MFYKTRAIVLYNLNYSDTYSIVHMYTETFGPVSYLTALKKGKKTHRSKTLFYPLSVLYIEVEHQNLREIQRLKEVKIHIPFLSILTHPVKSTMSIFLAEFIGKITKESQPNQLLFDYLFYSLQILDLVRQDFANFHLVFMIRLSRFLGIYPDARGYQKGMFFDCRDGVFVLHKPLHVYFIHPDESQIFYCLLQMNYENMFRFRFTRHERKEIIYRILDYYRLHLTNFPEIKSLEILHEVFG